MAFELDRIAPAASEGIRLLPILHERVDSAAIVRWVLETVRPATVAVELPTTLTEAARRAVARLPKISLVVSAESDDDALVWTVAPGDPLAEAIRWATEHGREVVAIDPDLPYPHHHADPVPDPWAMWTLGPGAYLEALRDATGAGATTDTDRQRERGMAHHLQQARSRSDGPIVALVGAAHVARLSADLATPAAIPFARQQRSEVLLRHLHPDGLPALLADPPLAHAVWELVRDGEVPAPPPFAETVSRRMEIDLVSATVRRAHGGDEASAVRRADAVARLAAAQAHRDGDGRPVPDRAAIAGTVWRVAAASWREQTHEETAPWQRRLFFDVLRRYARVGGRLVGGTFELVAAARGVGDDNLAWEAFDAARSYPWQDDQAELETARVDGELLDLGLRTIRFRRRFTRVKQRLVAVPGRRPDAPADPAEWLEAFDSFGICSYPPEDVVVEDWGRYLQRRAVSVLAAERSRSEPFTTSMLDGVDLRETLRRWHEGRIWVREQGRVPGEAGSVVVIFDEDPGRDRYPYLMTWLGEHEQESDMAFYATDPARQVVGPGILRATHGGFLLTGPPGRLFDVWADEDYREARSKPEVLLMAGVDYSTEKVVVYVAPSPPPVRQVDRATRRGRKIVYLPLGSLSPVSIRRLRVLHILAGHHVREQAKRYIW